MAVPKNGNIKPQCSADVVDACVLLQRRVQLHKYMVRIMNLITKQSPNLVVTKGINKRYYCCPLSSECGVTDCFICIGLVMFADHSGRSVMKCLRPLESWDRGFESHSRHGCLLLYFHGNV
jgi:hypothetical protein